MVCVRGIAEQKIALQCCRARWLCIAVALLGTALCAAPVRAQGSSTAPAEGGCTRQKDTYTCDWEAFRRVLPHMRSVTVETQPMDLFTAGELRRLADRLGKNVAARGQPADLTFLLAPVEPSGIDFGPADRPLATLQIYRGNDMTGGRKLLWVETFSGQPDRPWPTTVHALIQQFETRLGGH